MKVRIPLIPLAVGLEQRPLEPFSPRFTLRTLLTVVALLAVLLGTGRWAYYRYINQTITKTYYIGDLIRPDGQIGVYPTMAELSAQAVLLKSSVTPDVWWFGTRSVTPFPVSMSLIIRHTEAGHQQVAEWLRERRTFLDTRKK
jgi:hypothetical protein